jgi:hypothetical protein
VSISVNVTTQYALVPLALCSGSSIFQKQHDSLKTVESAIASVAMASYLFLNQLKQAKRSLFMQNIKCRKEVGDIRDP